MKYLVVSDNHGDKEVLENIIAYQKDKVDAMFHCGDSELDPNDAVWDDMYVVTGNCDYDPRYKKRVTKKIGNDTIFMTHGHLSQVRLSMDQLVKEAQAVGATIALYGHTHELKVEVIDGILIVNPGSIRLPRGRYLVKTYAVITSEPTFYEIQYYNEKNESLNDLYIRIKK